VPAGTARQPAAAIGGPRAGPEGHGRAGAAVNLGTMTVRNFPAPDADERVLLEAWLDYYRDTLLAKCAGLTPQQLTDRSCPPSTMSLIGLVRHLSEMERCYVHRLADGSLPLRYVTDASPDGDFDDVAPVATGDDLTAYAQDCARSREVTGGRPLDRHLRWTYLYLIKEYGRHLGHADLLRERIDGAAGE
jgi:uncharacterized protein DUF664